MNFDELLTKDQHDAGAELQILHPVTSEPLDFYITVLGVDSQAWQLAVKKQRRDMIECIRQAEKEGKTFELSADDELKQEIEQLVAATTDWRGLVEGGRTLKFSEQKCRELYTKSPAVRAQVDRFIGNRANFTKD